jgi:hypothetical protein
MNGFPLAPRSHLILAIPIMLRRLTLLFCTISVSTLLLPLVADASRLQWDRTEARIQLEPGEDEARAAYTVTNMSEQTLRIARVKTSCGCTGSILDRKIMKPGESATITGTFHKGKRQGLNHNKLQVFLENQAEPVVTLHMIVQIPKLVEAKPQIVYWNSSTSKTERQVQVILDKRYVTEISSIDYDRAHLTIVEAADPDGKTDRILHILPKSFDVPTRQTVRIKARGKDGILGEARLHIFVQP